MIGACIFPEADGARGCMLQLHKKRSFKEKMLGRAELTRDDPVLAALLAAVREEPGCEAVELEGMT